MKLKFFLGNASAPSRRAALAVLTLCIFNIYPMLIHASETNSYESGNLTIDALFDFEVPMEVISSGITNAWGDLGDDFEDEIESIFENNGWSEGWDEADWAFSTNGYRVLGYTNGAYVLVDTNWFEAMNDVYYESASRTNWLLPTNNPIGSVPGSRSTNVLDSAWSFLNRDAPPGSVDFVANPVVVGGFGQGFWIDHLTVSMLASFDGGAFDQWARGRTEGVLSWVPETWARTLNGVVDFVNNHSTGFRPYVRVVAVFIYWLALYRYFIRRIVLTVETVFESTGG